MNANPSACPHLNLTYDGTFAIVRCMDCDTTWDADTPRPAAQPRATTDGWTTEIWDKLAEIAKATDTILNPDNEPTSEHMQYKDNDQ